MRRGSSRRRFSAPILSRVATAVAARAAEANGGGSGGVGVRVLVSNLGPDVVMEDLLDIFSRRGSARVKRATVNFDKFGKSQGVGEVVFERRVDAVKAISELNEVLLDNRPMRLQLITTREAAEREPSVRPGERVGRFRNRFLRERPFSRRRGGGGGDVRGRTRGLARETRWAP